MNFHIGKAITKPGAPEAAVRQCESQVGFSLPEDYRQFLRSSNGCEGFIGPGSFVMLWSAEELASMNQGYETEKYLPGGLVFGSDGGGEAYAFDFRVGSSLIVQVPFVGMSWKDAIAISTSFIGFLKCLSERIP